MDYFKISSCTDVIRGDIAQPFVIRPVVIVFDKGPNRFLHFAGHIVRHLVDFAFYGTMVPLNLTVSLRMERQSSNVPYPYLLIPQLQPRGFEPLCKTKGLGKIPTMRGT